MEQELKKKDNNKLVSIIMIIFLLIILAFAGILIYNNVLKNDNEQQENNDNINEGVNNDSQYKYGLNIYLDTYYDTYRAYLFDNTGDTTNFKLVKTIEFKNANAKLLSNQYQSNFLVYYDEEFVVYDIVNDKSIKLNIDNEDILNYVKNTEFFGYGGVVINENKEGEAIGIVFNCFGYSNTTVKTFYYDIKNSKMIIDNSNNQGYTSINTTNDSNYLQISISSRGAQAIYYSKIYDLNKNKIIFDLIQDGEGTDIEILNINNKLYFNYTTSLSGPDTWGKIFDENKKLIVSYDSSLFELVDDTYLIGEDNYIVKYTMDGNKLSTTKKYDKVLYVGSDYSLVYEDQYIVLIKTDESYSKKIYYEENLDGYIFNLSHDKENNLINISNYNDGKRYTLNIKTGKVTKED